MSEDLEKVNESQALEKDPRGAENADSPFNVQSPASWSGAVLLADEIRYYSTEVDPANRMIEPFRPEQLRPAGYQLRLGEKVRIDGNTMHLDDENDFPLSPHGVAIVSTEETLRIPRFLIARWGLRVRRNYQGLLWTGGLAVDPGWVGNLNCPIYNLSNKAITLRRNDAYFTIDFVRTTALTDEYGSMQYQEGMSKTWFQTGQRSIKELDKSDLRSAPLGTEEQLNQVQDQVAAARDEARQELQQLRSRLDSEFTQFRNTAIAVMAIMFTAIGAVVAAIAAISVNAVTPTNGQFLSKWPMTVLVMSLVSLVISVFLLVVYSRRFGAPWPLSLVKGNPPKNDDVENP